MTCGRTKYTDNEGGEEQIYLDFNFERVKNYGNIFTVEEYNRGFKK